MVTAGEGEVFCSEHGDLMHNEMNQTRCDHTYEMTGPALYFEAEDMIQAIEAETEVLEHATELFADRYPERLAEIAAPLFDE